MGSDRRRIGLAVPMVLCWAAGAADLPAQSAQEPAPPVFEADVTLVAVPVFVTDKSGQAVAGLTAEDFEIYDGGRRVPIAAFQAIDVHSPVAAAAQPELPVAVQAAAHRQFVLFFDLRSAPPPHINRARLAATGFVRESLGSSDLVAVATYGSGGLKVLTDFTSDRAAVVRAIQVLGSRDALDSDPLVLGQSAELGAPVGGRASLLDRQIAEQMGLLQGNLTRESRQGTNDFLGAMKDLAQVLSSVRGRKQIVLFSGGFSKWEGPQSEAERFQEPGWMVVLGRMREVFNTAGLSDVVIHTISLAGLEGPIDVSSRTGRNTRRGDGLGALAALAENTGGRFILPTNNFGLALKEMEQVSRHYYVLAFQPLDPPGKRGHPHGLKVRVRGGKLSVSHRPAYVVPAASSESASESHLAALQLAANDAIGKGLSGASVRLQLLAVPLRDKEGRFTVPLVLHIDGPALAAVARGGRLDLQVYGQAMAAGRVLDTVVLTTGLDLSKADAAVRSEGVRLLTRFVVSPGDVELQFYVRVGASGEVGSLRRQVNVPAAVEGETMVSPAMLMLPATGKIAAPLHSRNGPHLEIPFRLGSAPFVPDEVSMQPGPARDLCVFVRRARAGSGDPLEVTGEIARPGEAPLPLRIEGEPRVVPDADGFDRYVVTVVPPLATPGAYTLRLTFRDGATGRTTRTETRIALEQPR